MIYIKNLKFIKHTIKHKIAFLKIEKRYLGRISIRGLLHDLDKVFLYLFLSKESVSRIHRKRRHHSPKTINDYKEMMIDWECARYTKPDKQLNAEDTLYKLYPHLEIIMLPLIRKYIK